MIKAREDNTCLSSQIPKEVCIETTYYYGVSCQAAISTVLAVVSATFTKTLTEARPTFRYWLCLGFAQGQSAAALNLSRFHYLCWVSHLFVINDSFRPPSSLTLPPTCFAVSQSTVPSNGFPLSFSCRALQRLNNHFCFAGYRPPLVCMRFTMVETQIRLKVVLSNAMGVSNMIITPLLLIFKHSRAI